MTIAIESLSLLELKAFLREQALDVFPALQDENRLTMLAEKWHTHAEFCTCRDESHMLVGMIAFYANEPESKEAFIPHVYVSPRHRRQGLFTLMLEKVMSVAQDRRFERIKLEVQKSNYRAQQSYLKNGFQFTASDSADHDSIFMNKTIGQNALHTK